jgi:hypothetical protein
MYEACILGYHLVVASHSAWQHLQFYTLIQINTRCRTYSVKRDWRRRKRFGAAADCAGGSGARPARLLMRSSSKSRIAADKVHRLADGVT